VEWLSVERMDIAKQAGHPLTDLLLYDLKAGEGWGAICISVKDIESFNGEIRNKGFRTSGVFNAQRKTPDGQLRKWKMLFAEQPELNKLPLPFFIQWEEAEEVRFAKLRKEGVILPANEKSEITECIFNVDNPLNEISKWANLLSQKISASGNIVLPNVVLKFIKNKGGKERLSEVVIEP
jgi:hypothetical protein